MPSNKDSARPKKTPTPTKTALRAERAKIAIPHPGMQFGYKHQIFISKLKRGEVWALNNLSDKAKVAVTPLFEMWPPNPATKTKPAKSLSVHTTGLMEYLANEWTGLPCYIDTKYLVAGGGPSPANAQAVFNIARTLKVNAIPVTSPYFAPAFQQIIRNVISTDKRGVMFRLPLAFFNDPQQIAGYLDGLAAALGVNRNQVDILIDLEYRPNVIEVQQMGSYCLNALPSIADWRTVTLASGCFPSTISDEVTGSWIPFARSDWNGWNTVAGHDLPPEISTIRTWSSLVI